MRAEAEAESQPNLKADTVAKQCPGRTRFAATFLLGTAIRVLVLLWARGTPFTSDARDYREAAVRLMSGIHFVPYWPPGLPLYLSLWLSAGGGHTALRASMLFFWAMLTWALWIASGELGFRSRAWLLLLAFAIMPASIQFSIETLTQQPAAALLLLALGSAAAWISRRRWSSILLLGLSLGWLSLVRPSSMALLLAIPAICLVASRSGIRRQTLAGPVLAMALGGVMVLGWMARAHALSGEWTINSSNGINLYDGNNPWTPMYKTWYFGSHAKPGTDEIRDFPEFEAVINRVDDLPAPEASKMFQRLAEESIAQNPGVFLVRTLNRVRCFFGFPTYTALNLRSSGALGRRLFLPCLALDCVLYLLLAGPAFFWIAAAPGAFWRAYVTWLFAASIVLYCVPYWLSMSHPTYNYPVVMPIAILGLLAWKTARAGAAVRWRGWAAVAVLLAIQVEWVIRSTTP